MKRRGFLGSLFALPAAAKALAETPKVAKPEVHEWTVEPIGGYAELDEVCCTFLVGERYSSVVSPYNNGTLSKLDDGSIIWRNK